jgi:rSAM/selenodomain-associated transferase 1
MKKAIIVFQKNLLLGKVKTRLAETISDEAALDCYSQMISFTHEQLVKVDADIHLYFSEFIEPTAPQNWQVQVQKGDDLGEKMYNAFLDLKFLGYDQVVIIGTDCLELTTKIINNSFASLNSCDFVLGPANDGGYYLLGLNELSDSLFLNKEWSNSEVFQTTRKSILQQNKTVFLLEKLSDIDTFEDLRAYQEKTGNNLLNYRAD